MQPGFIAQKQLKSNPHEVMQKASTLEIKHFFHHCADCYVTMVQRTIKFEMTTTVSGTFSMYSDLAICKDKVILCFGTGLPFTYLPSHFFLHICYFSNAHGSNPCNNCNLQISNFFQKTLPVKKITKCQCMFLLRHLLALSMIR